MRESFKADGKLVLKADKIWLSMLDGSIEVKALSIISKRLEISDSLKGYNFFIVNLSLNVKLVYPLEPLINAH